VPSGEKGAIQLCQQPGLALKPCDSVLIMKEFLREELECDIAAEFRIGRLVDISHTARPEVGSNLIVS
jgi:hypothetical protein